MPHRRYQYVGPEHVRIAAETAEHGAEIRSPDDLARWLHEHRAEREAGTTVATFVIAPDGCLRIASRRSEHVACAGGQPVLAAGEMAFDTEGRVTAVSNLSTGYCPEPESWPAVAEALDRARVPRPQRYTNEFVFRRCPECGERNLVKDSFFVCALCDADLPDDWNFGSP